MSERVAVYAGSFDPPHFGHLWMIQEGARLFDTLIVAVANNPDKKSFLSFHDRLEILRLLHQDMTNVQIVSFDQQFVVDYTRMMHAQFLLRGIRNTSDFEYEKVMRNINEDLKDTITTVFLVPPREFADLSSSLVRGLVGFRDWERVVKKYVPLPVLQKMREAYDARSK